MVRFEYHHKEKYVRRLISLDALTEFLTGQSNPRSNMGEGTTPVELEAFISQEYLPRCARPRFTNDRSYNAERDLSHALIRTLGKIPLHEIRSRHSEDHKDGRLGAGRANNTIKRELRCLKRVLDYAVAKGRVQENPLPPVRGLTSATRREIWLNKAEIDKLVGCCPDELKPLVEFLVLTGARIREALDLQEGDIDVEKGILRIPTQKRRRSPRAAMRKFEIATLGGRFQRLMAQMVPHPETKKYFHFDRHGDMSYSWVSKLFREARSKAGFKDIKIHDLRGSFCMHRAVVVKDFRTLQQEMGHASPSSIQSYLDSADHLDRADSIFTDEAPVGA